MIITGTNKTAEVNPAKYLKREPKNDERQSELTFGDLDEFKKLEGLTFPISITEAIDFTSPELAKELPTLEEIEAHAKSLGDDVTIEEPAWLKPITEEEEDENRAQ